MKVKTGELAGIAPRPPKREPGSEPPATEAAADAAVDSANGVGAFVVGWLDAVIIAHCLCDEIPW
jgi:hypothetical protein